MKDKTCVLRDEIGILQFSKKFGPTDGMNSRRCHVNILRAEGSKWICKSPTCARCFFEASSIFVLIMAMNR